MVHPIEGSQFLKVPGSAFVKFVQLVNNVSRDIKKLFAKSNVKELSKEKKMSEAI